MAIASLKVATTMLVFVGYHIFNNYPSIFSFRTTNLSINPTPFFIFGDSWIDPGNNNYFNATTLFQANFPPYGETYFGYPTGRFCNGRNIPDFIVEQANLLKLIPPYLASNLDDYISGVSFASGGAGALAETYEEFVIPLETQAKYFKNVTYWLRRKLGSYEAEKLLSSAVYLVFIGNNDYVVPFNCSDEERVDMVVGNTTSVIQEIYSRGARKFVLINMPPLGCLPNFRVINPDGSDSCFKNLSALVDLHNQVLPKALLKLENQLEGFKFSLYDYHAELTQMINHPSKYGLREGKSACCGSGGKFRANYTCGGMRGDPEYELCDNPDEHVFWDCFHLTESAYKQVAIRMWDIIKHFFQVSGSIS